MKYDCGDNRSNNQAWLFAKVLFPRFLPFFSFSSLLVSFPGFYCLDQSGEVKWCMRKANQINNEPTEAWLMGSNQIQIRPPLDHPSHIIIIILCFWKNKIAWSINKSKED